MIRSAIFAGAMAAAAAFPAAAQSWGVGIEFGGPGYYGPPPGYYEAPRYYDAPVYAPVEPMLQILPPDVIFDALEDAGYQEFSPMAPRGNLYKLNAVNPRGDLVALSISVFNGAIEEERILAFSQRPPLRALRSAPEPRAAPVPRRPIGPSPDDGDDDPLVVY